MAQTAQNRWLVRAMRHSALLQQVKPFCFYFNESMHRQNTTANDWSFLFRTLNHLHQLFFFSQLTSVARTWPWKDVQASCSVGSTQHNLWDYPFRAMALAFTWNAVRETCVTLLTAWEFILWCWYLFSLYLCSDTCFQQPMISFAKHL